LASAVAAVVTAVVVTDVEAAVAVIRLQAPSGKHCVGWVDLGALICKYADLHVRCVVAMTSCHSCSMKGYVCELVQFVRELEGTPYHPGGSH